MVLKLTGFLILIATAVVLSGCGNKEEENAVKTVPASQATNSQNAGQALPTNSGELPPPGAIRK